MELNAPGFRPLYRQVQELFRQRIADGTWRPGQALPAEPRLAAELNVSQGTVRKALDELAAQSILVRHQGRGTFVAEHTEETAMFRFFRLAADDGSRLLPTSRVLSCAVERAAPRAQDRLGLGQGDAVVAIRRLRLLADRPAIYEFIAAPAELFPGLAELGDDLPNTLYDLYQRRWGVTIGRAVERLKAVPAPLAEAEALGAGPGDPLLEIDRVAQDLEGRAVEWRVSHCRCDTLHYESVLE